VNNPISIFAAMDVAGAEQVVFNQDAGSGLRSIIVVHDTTLGPALGGVRVWPYDSEIAALADGLRLAEAMTLKAAAAGVELGGGASLVIGNSGTDKTDEAMRAHGRFIACLGGRFIPVNDVGTTQDDIRTIGEEASPVCAAGDPSPYTALGVLESIRACLRDADGTSGLDGVTVVVQGAGNVGGRLAELLVRESAQVIVADVDRDRAERVAGTLGVTAIPATEALRTPCDVLAPCALGPVVNERSLSELRCRIIAGGANNILDASEQAADLHNRGILYAPDFLTNAGGLIYLEGQLRGRDTATTGGRIRGIAETVSKVLERSRRESITTVWAATMIATDRLEARRRSNQRTRVKYSR
jgi:leucine dehydrogenase